MNPQKRLKELTQAVYRNRQFPAKLNDLYLELATFYGQLTDFEIAIKMKQAEYWEEFKTDDEGKKISDKKLEMMWYRTEEGKQHLIIKKVMKAVQMQVGAVKQSLYTLGAESRNQY